MVTGTQLRDEVVAAHGIVVPVPPPSVAAVARVVVLVVVVVLAAVVVLVVVVAAGSCTITRSAGCYVFGRLSLVCGPIIITTIPTQCNVARHGMPSVPFERTWIRTARKKQKPETHS